MTFAERIDALTIDDLKRTGATKWIAPGIDIGAFIAEMDFGVAAPIQSALRDSVDAQIFGYLPASMLRDVQQATAAALASRGYAVPADRVIAVPDVLRALELTLTRLTSPAGKVIVPTPSYMPFLFVPPRIGREVIEVPMIDDAGTWRFDIDALRAAFAEGGEILLLCQPFNPLGRVFAADELAEVSAVVEEAGGHVFADEIWAPLILPGADHVSYATVTDAAAQHTVTATSAAKGWNLPGLKCAQLIVAGDADRERFDDADWISHGASTMGATATIAAYTEGEPWLADVVDYLDGNRAELLDLVSEHLPGVTMSRPEGTYVGWLDFTALGIENPGAFFAENAGVGVTDGRGCGAAGVGSARFIFATPRPIMRDAITRMGQALRNHDLA
ncbi:MalY/PatB family protein [Paramicrobacterium chengjingii]|uniref:cysteine-S-conjugate beta-lyase n=2 Tax=Paramicrobacterium chengjingii TaxID=2769067 RepID=A0ABX6YK95_9MICO|nr:aminotransferase class I/II-fold pyridoxal phosphate-dependent enzyme [Microbacterium chengjingii]QPZ39249.1 aminotransferase class I/II-fold pyridoxal phosphate-dependent enzyme [Microbacterium chengjingii]